MNMYDQECERCGKVCMTPREYRDHACEPAPGDSGAGEKE